MTRTNLPGRRALETIDAALANPDGTAMPFVVSIGRFEDGRVAEIFIEQPGASKAPMLRDAGKILSRALQNGVPLAALADAVTRAEDGRRPSSLIGAAVDAALQEEKL